MVKYIKYTIIISVVICFFVSCGETIYSDRKSISEGHVEFSFVLKPSEKNHSIYFNYYYKLKSAYESIDFKAKLICPDGKLYEDRIRDKDARKDAGRKVVITGKKWRVFKIKPIVGGTYKLIVDVLDSNFKIQEAEIQIKR